MRGKAKWFDVTRGYGFISSGGEDYLVNYQAMISSGFRALPPGAEVEFEPCDGESRVLCIKHIDASACPKDVLGRANVIVCSETPWMRGIVKWYNRPRGYGFITVGKIDVFVHATQLRDGGFRDPKPGDVFEVRYGFWERAPGIKTASVTEIRVPQS